MYDKKPVPFSPEEIPKENLLAGLGQIIVNYQNSLNLSKRQFERKEIMQSDLVDWLIDGEFCAFGFPFPAAGRPGPKLILAEF